ncbi:MAG: FAD-dependent thymidylate synthase, partial [Planctomycetes bacterium]|nr:FAD-dependent thymidylate synthase [Planctomycetota bacterium]
MNHRELLEKWGTPQPVLDGGHVRLVDVMGDDNSIVQAARISYGAGTETYRKDRGLIRYMMRHEHGTPFEMCMFKIHVKAPIEVARQWFRHRTFSYNEFSTRYSEVEGSAYRTTPDDWRRQSTANKQGSSEEAFNEYDTFRLSQIEEASLYGSERAYQALTETGVAREQARRVL